MIDVLNERRRAITEKRVVKAGMRPQCVCAFQNIHKQGSRILRGTVCPVKMNLFVLIIGSDPNHIALITNDVKEFKLFEQAAKKFVGVTFLTANFDRHGNVLTVVETEAQRSVCGIPFAIPIIDQEIDMPQLAEM
jgi:hypothetical protein